MTTRSPSAAAPAQGDPAGFGLRLSIVAMASLAVTLWGATPLATKLAVTALDPIAVGILRTVVAALVAGPVLLLARMAPPGSAGGRLYLLISALGGYVVFPILFSIGQQLTSASHGAMILALTPIFTGLIAAALNRVPPRGAWWIGSAVAFTGTAVLIGETLGLAGTAGDPSGDLLVLAASIAAASGYVAGARAAREAGTWSVTLWGIVLASGVLLPILPYFLSAGDLQSGLSVPWAAVVYLALVSSIIAYSAWYWALAKGDIGTTGTIQFAQPVIGIVLAAWILAEAMSTILIFAAVLIIFGVALAQRSSRPRKP